MDRCKCQEILELYRQENKTAEDQRFLAEQLQKLFIEEDLGYDHSVGQLVYTLKCKTCKEILKVMQ